MTNEEALNHAKQLLEEENWERRSYGKEYTELCASVLEKQIPKKPHSITFSDVGQVKLLPVGFCPNCRFGVEASMDYCNYCGQKLDWACYITAQTTAKYVKPDELQMIQDILNNYNYNPLLESIKATILNLCDPVSKEEEKK